MSAQACTCEYGFSNSGTDNTPLIKVAKKMIVLPLYDSTGERNKIPFASVFNQAFWQALVDQTDKTKRYYPLPEMKNVEDTRGASTIETMEDNSKVFIQQGARDFKALFVQAPQQLINVLQSYRCDEVGVFFIDLCNNVVGSIGNDQDACEPLYLYPIRIDQNSIDPIFMKMTDKASQKIELNFSFHMDENDGDLRVITQAEAGYNVSLLRGLLDVCAEFSNITTTGFRVALRLIGFGTPITPLMDKGLLAANFTLYNETDSAPIVITSITETVPGVSGLYDAVIPAQTIGDVLELTPSKSGRDYTLVVENTFQIATT